MTPTTLPASLDDLTVVVPVRNAEHWVGDCLDAILASQPHEVIVVDGLSRDATVDIALDKGCRVLSDGGEGVPAARRMGAETATTRYVALIDVDVRLHEGALQALLDEFVSEGYTALQAGLHSVSSDGGYWGEALAHHHRNGRSKQWFGVVATIFERDVLLEHGFDESFKSGEDIDLRWRLIRSGAKIGVSTRTVVEHRFDDTWEFAKGQWLMDGHGLGRMIGPHGLRSLMLLLLPLAAALRGIAISVLRLQPQWIPYYVCYCVGNYVGMSRELSSRRGPLVTKPAGA